MGLILEFGEVGFTFESQFAVVNTFAITCNHRADGIEQAIYAKGYLPIFALDVAAAKDYLVQSLLVLLLDFRLALVNVAEIFEEFANHQGGCICTKEILNGFRVASGAPIA